MGLFFNIQDLKNESDVEQKFIIEFLRQPLPSGCGYALSDISTKSKVIAYEIGKAKKKSYFPDYIVHINGTPVVIIEAKSPSVDLNDAYNEARLYAHELNSQWKHNENPCKRIMVTNGLITLAGFYDQNEPIIELEFNDLTVENINYSKLREFLSKEALTKYWEELIKQKRKDSRFDKPVGRIGFNKASNAEIKSNSFGEALALHYDTILVPDNEDDYKNII